jgi:hypothetical protein
LKMPVRPPKIFVNALMETYKHKNSVE